MISCTEFIPLYSEFFKFLEKKGGYDAVMEYWLYVSEKRVGNKTNPHSLAAHCEKNGGYGGARTYWGHTLTEEACDFIKLFDDKEQYIISHMRHCPSRGKLNELEHIEPYYNYCEHCNVIYTGVLNQNGMEFLRDHSKIDNAECRALICRKGHVPDIDWKNITDDELRAMSKEEGRDLIDLKTEDNKYLHRDFHLSGDAVLKYCAGKYGDEAVVAFLSDYVKCYYAPRINEVKENGLPALQAFIEKVYDIEEASEVLHTELSENKLTVIIDKSPVIEYMHSINQEPSVYYIEETRTLYKTIADACGLKFTLYYYNEDGGTKFEFVAA